MYYFLTEAAVNRVIHELREYWKYHPKFRDDLVDNIQGKYSFTTRPQHAIIVRLGGGTRTRLSPDNYMGLVYTYVYHQKVYGQVGTSVEWVREDAAAISRNGGEFPSPPGIYYIEVTGYDSQSGIIAFEVSPLLTVVDEIPAKLDSLTYALRNPFVEGSLRVNWMPSNTPWLEGASFTSDPETGELTLAKELPEGTWLSADYRFASELTGPHYVKENYAHFQAIPGAVIAFGRRAFVGDKVAICVSERREPSYMLFGGRWDLSIECEVMSRDVHTQREISDASIMYVMGPLRSLLTRDGIEISEVSMGGESEEIYDENADDYFYNASFTINMTTDWNTHVPIVGYLRAVLPLTYSEFLETADLSDEEVARLEDNFHLSESLGLISFRDPFFTHRNQTFELIR